MVSAADLQAVTQQLQDAIATVNGELLQLRMRADSTITDMRQQDQLLRNELSVRTTEIQGRITDAENNITGIQTSYQGLSRLGTDQVNMAETWRG